MTTTVEIQRLCSSRVRSYFRGCCVRHSLCRLQPFVQTHSPLLSVRAAPTMAVRLYATLPLEMQLQIRTSISTSVPVLLSSSVLPTPVLFVPFPVGMPLLSPLSAKPPPGVGTGSTGTAGTEASTADRIAALSKLLDRHRSALGLRPAVASIRVFEHTPSRRPVGVPCKYGLSCARVGCWFEHPVKPGTPAIAQLVAEWFSQQQKAKELSTAATTTTTMTTTTTKQQTNAECRAIGVTLKGLDFED